LREQYQIVTKYRPEVIGVRVAVAAFNVAEEVDRLLDALVKIVPAL
jgi:selenocysteine lyase/cysteine desulfurase